MNTNEAKRKKPYIDSAQYITAKSVSKTKNCAKHDFR